MKLNFYNNLFEPFLDSNVKKENFNSLDPLNSR